MDTRSYTASFIPTEVAQSVASVAPVVTPVVEEEMPIYYVIISTVSTAKQANAILAGMDRSVFKSANVLKGESKHRIYADRFNNREKADNYMAQLRKNPKYADAWIYVNP